MKSCEFCMFPEQLFLFYTFCSTVTICGEQQKPHRISAVLPRTLQQPINIPASGGDQRAGLMRGLRRVSLSAVLLPASTCQPRYSALLRATPAAFEELCQDTNSVWGREKEKPQRR